MKNMIDMHSHILPNIDDGSYGLDESIEMIKEAYNVGFTKIVSTSHFIEDGSYNASKQEREKLILDIEEKLRNENMDIQIYNGSEAYVSTNFVELIQKGILPTINGTKYLLFELPMNSEIIFLQQIISELKQNGIVPIIAHPERYLYVQKNPEKLEELVAKGVLFQANYGSIIGRYGNDAKKTVKKLLKKNMIHFLGTDAHKSGKDGIYSQLDICLKKLEKLVGKEKLYILTTTNPEKVLKNEDILH